ncbi:MoxR family ATPase, partial [bacterium]|nr:MoxR family ATPase [bacterium]
FMLNIIIDYPSMLEEMEIVRRTTSPVISPIEPVLNAADTLSLQELVKQVPAADEVIRYAVMLVSMTRPDSRFAPDFVKKYIQWGAGPRACQYLVLGSKARTILSGRYAVSFDDIDALAPLVLRHRIITTFHAEAEGISKNELIAKLLHSVRNCDLAQVS